MKKTSLQSGFSLVETLVAITILLIVIVGPMTISSTSARSTSFASEQVTAFFLAQEGTELVRKLRDDVVLEFFAENTTEPWADFLATINACTLTGGCAVEIDDDSQGTISVDRCSLAAGCQVYLRETGTSRSLFTHDNSGATDTPFTRVVTVEITGDEAKVISTVSWRVGSLRDSQSVEVETYLFNVYGE